MQIILPPAAKLGAGTGVGQTKDEEEQLRATNKMRGELSSMIDLGELSFLGESDFCQLSLAPVELDDQMILLGIGSSGRKRLPARTAHFGRKFGPRLVPIGRR